MIFTFLARDKLLNKVPVILKTLYDEDVIDEENILEWAKKVRLRLFGSEVMLTSFCQFHWLLSKKVSKLFSCIG